MGDALKMIALVLAGLALLFGVLFVTGAVGNVYDATIGRQAMNVRRENFEKSKSYVHGKVDDLAKYKREYERATDPAEKKQIRNYVLSDFANFDKSLIENRDLRNFLEELERGAR